MTSELVNGANSDWMTVVGGTGATGTGAIAITAGTAAKGATQTLTWVNATAGNQSVSINGTTVNYTATGGAGNLIADATAFYTQLSAVADDLGITATNDGAGHIAITNTAVGSTSSLQITAAATAFGTLTNATTFGSDASLAITGLTADNMTSSGNTVKVVSGTYEGLEIKVNSDVMHATSTFNVAGFTIDSNNSLTLHIGANEGQNTSISLNKMDAATLGVNTLNLTTQAGAEAAIKTIDSAITTVSSERAKLGAMQNRLEHTINNLGTSSENLSAAESQIRDVDMAKEMTEFTKNNILSQAAQSMLAQANQQPQSILQLLQ